MFCAVLPPLSAQPSWNVTGTLNPGGEGGWDHLAVDAENHRLFVARDTHTQVVDTETGALLADIPGQKEAHGVVIVPRLNRGFISDGGGTGSIVIFDLKTYQVLGKLAALSDIDVILYDPGDKRVLVASGEGNALITFRPDVDPVSGAIDPPIKLGGSPESLSTDGKGKAYINLEDKNVVAVVDLNTRKVIARWSVAPGGHPVAMDIDARTHRLFIGTRNPQKLIVINSDDGHIEAALPIGAGVDGVTFAYGQVFVSCVDGSLAIAGSSSGRFGIEQTLATRRGSRTLAIDAQNRRIYMPAAEFLPVTTGWPKVKPGTFGILVLRTH
jgi:outer membrane protein assembly factor BamB